MDVQIQSLTNDRLQDFLHFFDEVAFADNPDWGNCYCMYYHFQGSDQDWGKTTKKGNRQCYTDLIKQGGMNGYLAYKNDMPIGWCNVNRKNEYFALKKKNEFLSRDDDTIVSIGCFVIAHDHRKKGLARMLLQRVIQDHADRDCKYLEAYPKISASSDAGNFRGPLALYLDEDFKIHAEVGDFRVVRKEII